jgi:hypothetical protein
MVKLSPQFLVIEVPGTRVQSVLGVAAEVTRLSAS